MGSFMKLFMLVSVLGLFPIMQNFAEAIFGNGGVFVVFNRIARSVDITITDLDGINNYFLFTGFGIAGPIEEINTLECPTTYTISLPVAHQVHQHTVVYADCQNPLSIEEWLVPPATGIGPQPGTPVPFPTGLGIDVLNEILGVQMIAVLSNGSVESIDVDPDFTSIILRVVTSGTEDGELMVTLPRALIDAKANGADNEFIVFVDGDEVEHTEQDVSDAERTLIVPVSAATEQVEIVGTQVIPEFPFAMLAIVGVFAVMIAAYRLRTRLNRI